ncbi:MAG: formylglycine-generating enzyme family protein, partial [Alkalinema sp. CAN_BIN05]|nr:formylglycine-generating enzyme family protein [Alkalinema sp. CAN_BIN05]
LRAGCATKKGGTGIELFKKGGDWNLTLSPRFIGGFRGIGSFDITDRLSYPFGPLHLAKIDRWESIDHPAKTPLNSPFPMPLTITRRKLTAQFYPEDLGNSISLDVVSILGGSFQMGSPEDEPERNNNEGPQHLVRVPDFFMGKYQVTQAQWRSVSNYPQENIKLNSNPSNFKGDDLPVEQVSWDECVEFCMRLSTRTGRHYRLPSESEWEYACRGGTETPFAFGKTLTTELANYDGNYSYANGPKGEYLNKTTSVGQFVANTFGLYDMHGNIYEWCEDHWHRNYEKAPDDGSAWLKNTSKRDSARVLRGGSWIFVPGRCRSAFRNFNVAGTRNDFIGFRVVSCVP